MNHAILRNKRVAIVGLGGLGSPVAMTLVKAGVRNITVIDPDRVEPSNLHRQILFDRVDIGRKKAHVVAEKLGQMDSECHILAHTEGLDENNSVAMLTGHDVICEGTDSLEAKYVANDTGVALGIPVVIAGALRLEGQVLTVLPKISACYRCVFESLPSGRLATCFQNGVLGPVVGFTAGCQAKETLLILRDRHPELAGKVWMYDALRDRERRVAVRQRTDCETCGDLRHDTSQNGVKP